MWDIVARRVVGIPEYRARFAASGAVGIHINDISMALLAFIGSEFRATDRPFARYLCG